MNYIDLTVKKELLGIFREKAEMLGAKIISIRQGVLDSFDIYIEADEKIHEKLTEMAFYTFIKNKKLNKYYEI